MMLVTFGILTPMTMGMMYFEIRKAANELTNEFQSSVASPVADRNKEFKQTKEDPIDNTKLLTYEVELPNHEVLSKDKCPTKATKTA